MAELCRRPGIGAVAIGTFPGGLYVGGALPGRLGPVVAGRARAQHVSMIDCTHWRPGAGGVAILADVIGRDVRCRLAGGCGAIVASGTVARYTGVTEGRRRPRIHVVARRTLGRSLDVCCVLPRCLGAVVAGRACPQNSGVVDDADWRPGSRSVAILADVVGRDMVGGLACRQRTIVARGAIAADPGVAKAHPGPCLGGVAGCAIIRSGNMPRAFAGGL